MTLRKVTNPLMDGDVMDALEISILKWEYICQGYGVNMGAANCELCNMFLGQNNGLEDCAGCPVHESTGLLKCHGTPYYEFSAYELLVAQGEKFDLPRLLSRAKFREIGKKKSRWSAYKIVDWAEAELKFLLSLLPKGHSWSNQA